MESPQFTRGTGWGPLNFDKILNGRLWAVRQNLC